MNIPTGYRRVTNREIILATDLYQSDYGHIAEPRPMPEHGPSGWIGRTIEDRTDHYTLGSLHKNWQILRKIDSPWISVKERLPDQPHEWYFVKQPGLYPGSAWWTGGRWADGRCGEARFDPDKIAHWMPMPPLPEPIIPPIIIQEGGRTHELIFNKDGSIKAGCVTIDNETVDKIIVRRMEAKS